MSVRYAGLLAVFALSFAGASRGQDLPPAFPRDGATLILDNAWGSVWDVVYTPGKPTPMHRHRFDFVGVELADSAVTITTLDGRRKTFPEPKGDSYFLPRGTTHIEETPLGSPARHAVIIDLKDGSPPGLADAPVAFQAGVATKVADNPRVIVWDHVWVAGRAEPAPALARNVFIVFVTAGVLSTRGAAAISVAPGQVIFEPAGAVLPVATANGSVRGVVVELK